MTDTIIPAVGEVMGRQQKELRGEVTELAKELAKAFNETDQARHETTVSLLARIARLEADIAGRATMPIPVKEERSVHIQ